MRRFVAPSLLSLLMSFVGGCYLFGDEPKARKQPGSEVGEDPSEAAEPTPKPEPPQPEGQVADCPAFLTGTEAKARTIAAACPPVRVRGQYRIDGGTLTLEAGVELRFEEDAVLEVGRDRPGAITIAGTPEQPVRLIADGEGGWQGVRLHAQSTGSSLQHVEIANAGSTDQAALWIAAEQLTVENITVRDAPALALEVVAERGPALLGVTLAGTSTIARVSPSAAASLQELKLEPTAFVAISSGTIASTIEWPPNPYRIEGVIRIEGDVERPGGLTLAPGASLYFTPEARIIVGGFGPGSLSASASASNEAPSPDAPGGPIKLLAAQDSRAGAWSGIHVQDHGELILRNVELGHGGSRDEGVVIAEGTAKLTLEGCELHDNLVGVELRGHAVVIEGFSNNGFRATPVAIRSTPALLGGVGADNRYDELAYIDVSRGKVESDATWTYQSASILIHGDVFVDKGATLTVAPGVRLGFDPGVLLGVGYYEQATVDMRGTAEAPIVLEAISEPWGGVVLGDHARNNKFEQVRLRKTGNAAGVELRDGADATLVNIDCAACANATVKWDCASKVGNIGITASEGTPTTLAAPTQCK